MSVLLAFLDSGIASDQTGMLKCWSQVNIILEQGARDAVTNSAGLTRWTTAGDVDEQIKLVRRLSQLQWLTNDHAERFVGEVPVESLVIDLDLAAAWSQIDPRGR